MGREEWERLGDREGGEEGLKKGRDWLIGRIHTPPPLDRCSGSAPELRVGKQRSGKWPRGTPPGRLAATHAAQDVFNDAIRTR